MKNMAINLATGFNIGSMDIIDESIYPNNYKIEKGKLYKV
jgi:hypothetical protein